MSASFNRIVRADTAIAILTGPRAAALIRIAVAVSVRISFAASIAASIAVSVSVAASVAASISFAASVTSGLHELIYRA